MADLLIYIHTFYKWLFHWFFFFLRRSLTDSSALECVDHVVVNSICCCCCEYVDPRLRKSWSLCLGLQSPSESLRKLMSEEATRSSDPLKILTSAHTYTWKILALLNKLMTSEIVYICACILPRGTGAWWEIKFRCDLHSRAKGLALILL